MPYFTLKAVDGCDYLYRVFSKESAESDETPSNTYLKKGADNYYLVRDITDEGPSDAKGAGLLVLGTLSPNINQSITLLANRLNSSYYRSQSYIPHAAGDIVDNSPSFTLKAVDGCEDLYQVLHRKSSESKEIPSDTYLKKGADNYYLARDIIGEGPRDAKGAGLSVIGTLSHDADKSIIMLSERYKQPYYPSESLSTHSDSLLSQEQVADQIVSSNVKGCPSQAHALSIASAIFITSPGSGSGSSSTYSPATMGHR